MVSYTTTWQIRDIMVSLNFIFLTSVNDEEELPKSGAILNIIFLYLCPVHQIFMFNRSQIRVTPKYDSTYVLPSSFNYTERLYLYQETFKYENIHQLKWETSH